MKKIIGLLVLLLLFTTSAFAVDCSFRWRANPESSIAGYKLYYSQISGDKSTFVNIQNPIPADGYIDYTISGLEEGVTYYFTIIAYDTDGFDGRHFVSEINWFSPSGDASPLGGIVNFGIPNAGTMSSGDYRLTVNLDNSISINGLTDCPEQEECPSDSLDGLSSGVYELFVFADKSIDIVMIENSAPVVSISSSLSDIIDGDSITITATASDPEGDALSYIWYLDGEICGFDSSVNLTDLPIGTHSVYVVVSDENNSVNSQIVSVNVLEGPHLSVPDVLVLTANFGDDFVSGNIEVKNVGNGDMGWEASTTSGILSIAPYDGVNDGIVNVTADLSGLDPGEYYGDVIVISSNTENSPKTVPVQIVIAEDSVSTTTILVGPDDWIWNHNTPTIFGPMFNGDIGYSSNNNVYFQSVGDAFVVTDETKYINIRLYFENPSVLVLQMRNKNLPRRRWKRAMFSSFNDSWSSRSRFTGWFNDWGVNVDAQNEFLNLPTGFVEMSIDLTTNGFVFGDVCDGLAFSVHPSDPAVIFGDVILSSEPLYSTE